MKTTEKIRSLVFILGFFLFSVQAQADIQVKSGATLESPDANTFNVRSNDDKAIIEYDSFSILENQRVNFIQPSNNSTWLNRVGGSESSQILGIFTANGNII